MQRKLREKIGNGESPIRSTDALATDPGERYQVVLINPPFGKKSSYKVIGEDGEVNTERDDYEREDFKFTTKRLLEQFDFHTLLRLPTGIFYKPGVKANVLKRDKLNLDIIWLKDDSLDDVDSLPSHDMIAAEIVENLQAALEAFQAVADELSTTK